jgi:zinc finger CCCH domain-containing protein 11
MIPMEDCYYFLYSSCKLGGDCTYRHCEQCKNNLITCKNWKANKKCRTDCPFRHSEYHVTKNRKEEMCYWEGRPEGCTKPRCEYKHIDPAKDEWKEIKIRSLSEIQSLKNSMALPMEQKSVKEAPPPMGEEESLISEESLASEIKGESSLKSGEDEALPKENEKDEESKQEKAAPSEENEQPLARATKRHGPPSSSKARKRRRAVPSANVDLDALDRELEELDGL